MGWELGVGRRLIVFATGLLFSDVAEQISFHFDRQWAGAWRTLLEVAYQSTGAGGASVADPFMVGQTAAQMVAAGQRLEHFWSQRGHAQTLQLRLMRLLNGS